MGGDQRRVENGTMNPKHPMANLRGWVLLAAVALVTTACAPVPPVMSGRAIAAADVAALEKGPPKTELLDRFGPPFAIMAPGQTIKIQGVNRWNDAGGLSVGGVETVDTDGVFALFADRHRLSADHRIYYYYRGMATKIGFVMVFWLHEKAKLKVERLWVLVNERSGEVEGHVWRKD